MTATLDTPRFDACCNRWSKGVVTLRVGFRLAPPPLSPLSDPHHPCPPLPTPTMLRYRKRLIDCRSRCLRLATRLSTCPELAVRGSEAIGGDGMIEERRGAFFTRGSGRRVLRLTTTTKKPRKRTIPGTEYCICRSVTRRRKRWEGSPHRPSSVIARVSVLTDRVTDQRASEPGRRK